ncbi:Allophanate hydrolase [hydrothermal vent metagenome]|uniref:Allophanate hydrolase n=1 Tax=hydrothermal vent metagenome TaxID=652676 RepID=A0A3B1AEX4_9ZZZZ
MSASTMNMTIASLLKAYRAKTLSPVQVVKELLIRCADYDDHNIWITRLTIEQIQQYLDKLEGHSPDSLPLYGIPFAIKDNIDLAGIPTTAACPEYLYCPEKSAFVVEQLINAGAIPIGKTNMDQFATGLVGVRSPAPWGPCKNAFNKAYISGGSSSGSSVAVSLGLVSFSLGTDTAGSGRVPAAFNNLVGLKPSKGLLSMTGVVPACRSLDCVSIFALTTDDANVVFEQAAVFDHADAYARKNSFNNNHRHYQNTEGCFSFAVPKQSQLQFFKNDNAEKLFKASVKTLESLGGVKTEIDFSPFLDAARLLYEGPWVAERYAAIENLITEKPQALLPVINTIIGGAVDKTAVDAFKAGYKLQHYKSITKKILSAVDVLITPTVGTIYKIDEVENDPVQLNNNLGFYTNYMNLLDYSCVAAPSGFLDNGLPWGISFVGAALQDRKLLSLANRFQQQLKLLLGATDLTLDVSTAKGLSATEQISVIVCGAHLTSLPLNWQLSERGAILQECTTTAKAYRMYALAGGPPYRPGLIRDEVKGAAIEIEIWTIPEENFGSFVAAIPAPLGVGKVETNDGRWLTGFICEAYAIQDAKEITGCGSWREHIRTM